MPSRHTTSSQSVIDHSLHGLVTIRLVSPPARVVGQLRATFGPSQGPSLDEPDVLVTFSERLPQEGEVRLLGLSSAAFDDTAFYVLDAVGRRARIDFDALGEPCRIACERGIGTIPLLLPIVSLRLLRKGHILLHASSFVHEGSGMIAAGWEKGGKTELLLAFMAAGAHYLADEWTIVSADGSIRGLGGNPAVWDWHLRSLPQYRSRVARRDRARMTVAKVYRRVYRLLPEPEAPSMARQWLHRLSLEGGMGGAGAARPSPERLFTDRIWAGPARLDRILFASVTDNTTRVLPIEPEEVASRMIASQRYERRFLLAVYDHFRFAFPSRRNLLLETAADSELKLLLKAFAGKRALDVRHPYPVRLGDLYHAVESVE
jgi:hypothetical protein